MCAAIISLVQIFTLSVPVFVAVFNYPIGRFVICSTMVFLSVLVVLFFMIFPKMYLVHTGKSLWESEEAPVVQRAAGSKTMSRHNTNTSPEAAQAGGAASSRNHSKLFSTDSFTNFALLPFDGSKKEPEGVSDSAELLSSKSAKSSLRFNELRQSQRLGDSQENSDDVKDVHPIEALDLT